MTISQRSEAMAWRSLNAQIVGCQACPRLRAHCTRIAAEKKKAHLDEAYWGRPLENFGDAPAELLIVGLAPAAHGANRTGRMFTGDKSGQWLYRALHKFGFATHSESTSREDGLRLVCCAITAVCHCAPPGNKPLPVEIAHCRPWLERTIDLARPRVLLALGGIAWQAVLDESLRRGWFVGRRPKFAHAAEASLADDRRLLASYHPSQQNTFTGRLTEPMFDAVFRRAKELLPRL